MQTEVRTSAYYCFSSLQLLVSVGGCIERDLSPSILVEDFAEVFQPESSLSFILCKEFVPPPLESGDSELALEDWLSVLTAVEFCFLDSCHIFELEVIDLICCCLFILFCLESTPDADLSRLEVNSHMPLDTPVPIFSLFNQCAFNFATACLDRFRDEIVLSWLLIDYEVFSLVENLTVPEWLRSDQIPFFLSILE